MTVPLFFDSFISDFDVHSVTINGNLSDLLVRPFSGDLTFAPVRGGN